MRRAVALVRDNCRWEHAGQPFFSGEVEPCINGRTVTLGTYFDQDVDGIVARLLGEQLEDGGWNCEAENGSVRSSFATTINVLEGLLAHERATGGSAESIAARRRGEEYLLERKLFRRKSTGEVVNPAWLQFSFPTRWHYDVLRALEYFRSVGDAPDSRMDEAIDLLRSKQQPDGTWLLENTHPGKVHFALEDGDGRPSRWNTLRALRVLSWYEQSVTQRPENYSLRHVDSLPHRSTIGLQAQVKPRRIDMRFISIFTHEPSYRPPTEAEMATMGKLIEEGMKAGWLIATEGVHFGATGVRVHKSAGGKVTVTDGPFAETKEIIGGYALLKAANKDEVVELTRRFLNVVGQGTCEIHQLYEMPTGAVPRCLMKPYASIVTHKNFCLMCRSGGASFD